MRNIKLGAVTGLPSCIYFFRLQAEDSSTSSGQSFMEAKKMILLK
jgi:hypothetical protein